MLCLAVAQVAGHVLHVGKKNSRVTGLRKWKVKADVRKKMAPGSKNNWKAGRRDM